MKKVLCAILLETAIALLLWSSTGLCEILAGGWWNASIEELSDAREAILWIMTNDKNNEPSYEYNPKGTVVFTQEWKNGSKEEYLSAIKQLEAQIIAKGGNLPTNTPPTVYTPSPTYTPVPTSENPTPQKEVPINTNTPNNVTGYYYTKAFLNVRHKPSKKSDKIGELKTGEKVYVRNVAHSEDNHHWYEIEFGSPKKTGYVMQDYLTQKEPIQPGKSTAKPKATKKPKDKSKPTGKEEPRNEGWLSAFFNSFKSSPRIYAEQYVWEWSNPKGTNSDEIDLSTAYIEENNLILHFTVVFNSKSAIKWSSFGQACFLGGTEIFSIVPMEIQTTNATPRKGQKHTVDFKIPLQNLNNKRPTALLCCPTLYYGKSRRQFEIEISTTISWPAE